LTYDLENQYGFRLTRMLRKDGRKDGNVTISHRNFVGEGITKQEAKFVLWLYYIVSWWSVLLVEETGGPGENHRPVVSH
jgi:hypothetical protein